jgi:6-phosphogluconate dehydrogenase
MRMAPTQADKLDFAIVGLGRIGANLARRALELGYKVAGSNRRGPPDDLAMGGLHWVRRPADLAPLLSAPRVVFVYVPAGRAVDAVLEELAPSLAPSDVVIDGGNSYWGDERKNWARAIAMMRKGFGGHPYGRDEAIARERHEGRLTGPVQMTPDVVKRSKA